MKRLVFNILISLLAIINIPALKSTAVENVGLEIGSSTVSAKSGDTVDVPVEIVSNSGVIAVCLDVQYDSDLIQLIEVEDCELFGDASFTQSGDYEQMPFCIMWDDALTPQNHTETGKLAVLRFKVSDKSFSETEIEIIPQNENIFDFNLDDVACNTAKSTIKIESGSSEQNESSTKSDSESTMALKEIEKTTEKDSESDIKADVTSEIISEENAETENNTENNTTIDDYNNVTSDSDSESQTNADYEEVEENTDNSNTGIIIAISVCAIAVIAVAVTIILKKKNK